MREPIKKHFGVLKTTAIGGVIFLLPLIVIGALLGQVIQIVLVVAEVLGEWIPVDTVEGWSLLVLLAIIFIVLLCFVAGLAARRSFAKRFSQSIEKNLTLFFPRYAIIKEQMAGSIAGDDIHPKLKPVIVTFDDSARIAFEVDRTSDGRLAVYLPGAPDPWSGHVAYLKADQVEPLNIEFAEAMATFEKLGRESAKVLAHRG